MTRLLATAVTLFRARGHAEMDWVPLVYFLFAAGVFVGAPGAFDPGQGVDFPAFPRAHGTGANLVRGIGVDSPTYGPAGWRKPPDFVSARRALGSGVARSPRVEGLSRLHIRLPKRLRSHQV